jgi:RNA polymerase sigma factor (sigma-70 family)
MTRALARKINCRLLEDELLSLADMALCEAARSYDPSKGAVFTTYLYYFIRGKLLALISEQKKIAESLSSYALERRTLHGVDKQKLLSESLEEKLLIKELRSCLKELPKREQEVIKSVFLYEQTVTEAARVLGFSRGHVSRVKSAGVAKLRKRLKLRMSPHGKTIQQTRH